jgi:membrane protein
VARTRGWIGTWRRLRAEVTSLTERTHRHRTSLAAGGLAYFVALSIAPAAVVVGRIAGFVLDPAAVRLAIDEVTARSPDQTATLAPAADSIAALIVQSSSATFTVATLVSLVVAVYGASRMVFGLRLALSAAFETSPRYAGLGERVAATVITLVGVVLAVVVMIALTVIPRVLDALGLHARMLTSVPFLDWAIATALLWLAVRGIISRGANHRMRVPWWAPGPILATIWILGASVGVGLYVRFSSSLGAAVVLFGSAVVVLLWLYLCFLGLLYGAEVEAQRQDRLRTGAGLAGEPAPLAGEPAGRTGDQRRDERTAGGPDAG